ncbi:hypothetical protein GQ457_10G008150 [Hibiscus cannabinus]
MLPSDSFVVDEYDQEDEQEYETLNSSGVPSQKSGKKPRHKGPMDLFVTPKAHPKKDEGGVHVACAKKLREKASRSIARRSTTTKPLSTLIEDGIVNFIDPYMRSAMFLNPELFYDNPTKVLSCEEVMRGLYWCIARLNPEVDIQDQILHELCLYQNGDGVFGMPMASRSRKQKSPADWWTMFGSSTPNVRICYKDS